MIAVPGMPPVTMPVVAATVAIPGLAELHDPPVVPSLRVSVEPEQTAPGPVIAAGFVLTVIGNVVAHPPGAVLVMVTLPADMPVTIPDAEPIEARATLLLVQVPPVVVSVRVTLVAVQTTDGPAIAAGAAFMVTCIVVVAVEYPSFTSTLKTSVPL